MATFLLQLQVAAREPYRYLLSEGGLCYIWLHKIGEYDILTIAACRYLITAEEQIGAFSCFDKKEDQRAAVAPNTSNFNQKVATFY